jgi:hypothetical protein
MIMRLSAAQIVALILAQPADDGQYHLTQESGVTYPTMRVLTRIGLATTRRFEDHRDERKNLIVPQYDWEITLTKTGLQQRDIWRRVLWTSVDTVDRQIANGVFDAESAERVLATAGV